MLYTFQTLYTHQLINPHSSITFPLRKKWETEAWGWEELAKGRGDGAGADTISAVAWVLPCLAPAALSWLYCYHSKHPQGGPGEIPQWDLDSSGFWGLGGGLGKPKSSHQGLLVHVHCWALVGREPERWPGTGNKTLNHWNFPLDIHIYIYQDKHM